MNREDSEKNQLTLQGCTLKELEDSYKYDSVTGTITNKITNKKIGYYTTKGVFVAKRVGDRTVALRAGLLVYFLHYKILPDGVVRFKDEDPTNLKITNLFVAQKGRERSERPEELKQPSWINTPERRISFNPFKNLWSVKRGKKDAVYWARSLEEAISIRNEWESDKTIQKRDFYHDYALRLSDK